MYFNSNHSYTRGRGHLRRLILALDGEEEIPPEHAAVVLATVYDFPIGSLLEKALYSETPKGLERAAADALTHIGPAAVPILLNALQEIRVSHYAALSLAQIGDSRAVQPLVKMLGETDSKVCCSIVMVLGRFGAVEPLLDLLGHRDDKACEEATQRLAQVGDRRAVQPLVALSTDLAARDTLRATAIDALGALQDAAAVEHLLRLLQDSSEQVRASAAGALLSIEGARAAEQVTGLLQDPSPEVRRTALRVVHHLKGRQALCLLEQALHDSDRSVRSDAVQLARHTDDPTVVNLLIEALGDQDGWVRELAASGLGQYRDRKAVGPLIAKLEDDVRIQNSAARSLGRIGDPAALSALVEMMRNTEVRGFVSATAVSAIGMIEHPEAARIIQELAADRDSRYRCTAACILARKGDLSVLPILVELLGESSQFTAATAARDLLQFGSAGFEALAAALQHSSEMARWAVALALGDSEKEEAAGPLRLLLQDSSARVRASAAAGLGDLYLFACTGLPAPLYHLGVRVNKERVVCSGLAPYDQVDCHLKFQPYRLLEPCCEASDQTFDIGGIDPVIPLIEAVTDPDAWVRAMAVRSLGRIGNLRALPALVNALADEDQCVIYYAALSLARIGDLAVDLLCKAVAGEEWALKLQAARLLGYSGSPAAVAPLAKMLEDPDWTLRFTAARALGRLGPSAIEPLQEALADPRDYVQEGAREALARAEAGGSSRSWGCPGDGSTSPKPGIR